MKLEFILNIIKAIIKVEGLSKAVMVMGDLRGSFFSSWDLQVFWLDSSDHKNNSRSLYFTDFLLWPGAQEATQSKKSTEGSRNWARHLVYVVSVPGSDVGSLLYRLWLSPSLGLWYLWIHHSIFMLPLPCLRQLFFSCLSELSQQSLWAAGISLFSEHA